MTQHFSPLLKQDFQPDDEKVCLVNNHKLIAAQPMNYWARSPIIQIRLNNTRTTVWPIFNQLAVLNLKPSSVPVAPAVTTVSACAAAIVPGTSVVDTKVLSTQITVTSQSVA